ncbi:MAG: uroporphyrinogen-III synthase [Betaproteobacteria bacterium]|nr:uroporphyrinogen-III synthase [Betaproteobacteria bacterium]
MLGGRGILVTRPRAQAGELAVAIVAHGGDPVLFPTIAIDPIADPAPAQSLFARLGEFDHAIFVSANAVQFGLSLASAPWPDRVSAIAVGPATAQALARASIPRVLTPVVRFDSEGVLALDTLQQLQGRRVLIVRGVGGRDLLEHTLEERGAVVDIAEVYSRHHPREAAGPLIRRWRAGNIHAVICTASEAARNLHASLATDLDLLKQAPVFVPHARIAAMVRALYQTDVIETATGDSAIVRAMERFFAKVQD